MNIIKDPSANEIHNTKCNNNFRCGSLKRIWAGDRKQGIYKAWPYFCFFYLDEIKQQQQQDCFSKVGVYSSTPKNASEQQK